MEQKSLMNSWFTFYGILGTFLALSLLGSTDWRPAIIPSPEASTAAVIDSITRGMSATGIACGAEADGRIKQDRVSNQLK